MKAVVVESTSAANADGNLGKSTDRNPSAGGRSGAPRSFGPRFSAGLCNDHTAIGVADQDHRVLAFAIARLVTTTSSSSETQITPSLARSPTSEGRAHRETSPVRSDRLPRQPWPIIGERRPSKAPAVPLFKLHRAVNSDRGVCEAVRVVVRCP
jgi:hypothetical protein